MERHRLEEGAEEPFVLEGILDTDVREYTQLVEFSPDELLMEEGENPHTLYYLLSGRVKVSLTQENGRRTLINFLSAPCFIGEMEFLDAERPANEVRAITACAGSAIDLDGCREELLRDAGLLRELCRYLSRKASGNSDHFSRNQSWPLRRRLAAFILQTQSGGYYREPYTEAAEYLGVTYRHLLYVLAQLVREGILEKTPSGYRIVDREALRAMDREFFICWSGRSCGTTRRRGGTARRGRWIGSSCIRAMPYAWFWP